MKYLPFPAAGPVLRLACSTLLALLCALPLGGSEAAARQSFTTQTEDGRPFLFFDIRDQGEEYVLRKWQDNPNKPEPPSAWTIGEPHRGVLAKASDYWATLFRGVPISGLNPHIIVGTVKENAAAAASFYPSSRPKYTELVGALLYGDTATLESSGLIVMGRFTEEYIGPLQMLTKNGNAMNYTATIVHEIGHAMGIGTSPSATKGVFSPTLSLWETYLADSFGKRALPGMPIALTPGGSDIANTFVLSDFLSEDQGYAYFQGPKALEVLGQGTVLGGADNPNNIPGVPIWGFEYAEENSAAPDPELSHIELRNSMMSHQEYRNWHTYMEAELAILQDIGIPLDRKNFFGTSIYGSGGVYDVTQGFYARNADGTAYLPGVYNTTPLTVGLHIYGDSNTVTMRGDALASGYGSTGIRVDGVGNALTVESGTKIHSLGEEGSGLMVSYGKNHTVLLKGELAATGPGGIGARFDFGDNLLGNGEAYRGSYIATEDGINKEDALPDVQGPLVSAFDISGSVFGEKAAIYMSENALVRSINVMNGANIQGDIISDWNPENPLIQKSPGRDALLTNITFGVLAGPNGAASSAADPNFSMQYRGNIVSPRSVNVELRGGALFYGGQMRLNQFHAQTDTTLNIAADVNEPSTINAQSINFDAGSTIGMFEDGRFGYGPGLSEGHPLLRLEGAAQTSGVTLAQQSISFSHGFYDYTFTNLHWRESAQGLELAAASSRTLSKERSAASSVTAPTAMAASSAMSGLLREHTGRLFTRKRAETAKLAAPMNFVAAPDESREAASGKGGETYDTSGKAKGISLWISPGYGYSRQHGSRHYSVRAPQIALGGDTWVGDNVFVGAGLYYAAPEYRSSSTDIDASDLAGMLYAGAFLPLRLEAQAHVSLGRTWYDQKRKVHDERYDTDYTANNYGVGFSVARSFELAEAVTLRPFAAYEFSHLAVEGYNEGTAGLYGLSVRRQEANLHRLEAGSEITVALGEWASINGSLFYSGLYGDRRPEADMHFSRDADKHTLNSKGWALDEHSLGLSGGISAALGTNAAVRAGYTFIGGKRVASHQGNLQFTLRF